MPADTVGPVAEGGRAPPSRRSEAPPIRISIGRITVQAPAGSPAPPYRRPRPRLSLSDYLAGRRGSPRGSPRE
jgi:hypothetical protein